MIGKIFAVFVMLALTFAAVLLIYENFPQEPVKMRVEDLPNGNTISHIDYSSTPVFMENLRFPTNDISYYIDGSCSKNRKDEMVRAFNLFEKEMGVISFYSGGPDSYILVGCSTDYIEVGENLFAAGEGGPSQIINTSGFKTIKQGKIVLYQETKCDYPVVEIHELSHVFGFDHSANEKSIVYPTYRCDQRITPDMVEIIHELYSIEPLPDLKISELIAVKKGRYLDFNITILNEGLKSAENVSLSIVSSGEIIETTYFGKIDIGYGRTLKAQNLKLPSREIRTIDFIIDLKNEIDEMDKTNNIVIASV